MSSSKEKEDRKVKEAKKNASDILSVLKEAISVKLHELLDEESTFDLIDSDFIMDYMMLVASSKEKSKSKIIEDLNFILNDKTEEFVNWYLDIWQKLSKVSTSKSLGKRGGGVAASLFQQVTNDLKRKYKDKIDPVGNTSVEQVEKLIRKDVTVKMKSENTASSLQSKKSYFSSLTGTQVIGSVDEQPSCVQNIEAIATTNKDLLSPLQSYESIETMSQHPVTGDREPMSFESINEPQPVQFSSPTEDAMLPSKSNKAEEDISDFEDVLVADTVDLNVSESSSSKESDSMSLGSSEYKSKQIDTKAKVNQWLKRRLDEDSSHLVKRQKLVSTVQMLEPETTMHSPSIPSVIAPPPSNRCVVPSQILLRAMRDANKSTVNIANTSLVERGSKRVPVKHRSQELGDIRMTGTNVRIQEEDQNLESSQGSSGHSGEMSEISQNDLEYYYENNDDLEYESDGESVPPDTRTRIQRSRSPTFVVTMNKDHQEYLATLQRPLKSNSAETHSQHKSSGHQRSTSHRSNTTSDSQPSQHADKRIVKMSSGIFSEYRTRAISDEDKDMDTLENFKRFKKFRETRQSRREMPRNKRKYAGSDSSEDELSNKIHKREPRDRDEPNLPVDKLKLESKSASGDHTMTPHYNRDQSSPGVNNVMSEYYSTMEEWIADPNHPMGLHLPPPMPLAPPPVMPPGFLPPPPPSIPPPMPPGFLPPPADDMSAGNGYEINVRVPAQNNNNLITVQCQNLDYSNKQSQAVAPATITDKIPCKFYPNCTKGDCPFFHRTKCTTFPLCRFGNKCAYLHPDCKFGASCSRVACVFDHSAVLKAKPPVTSIVNTSDVCKFHPKCLNANCVFFHPKICMYSSNCRNKACVFFHPAQDLPSFQNKITAESGSLNKVINKFSLKRVNA